jgi:hypothetical protein
MSSFNIQGLRTALASGGARPTLFRMFVNPPDGVSGYNDEATDVTALCKMSELPQSNIGKIEVPFMGQKLKVPGDRVYDPVTITIINDEDFGIRSFFEAWSNAVKDHDSYLEGDVWTNLVADLFVSQYGKDGTEIQRYTFEGAFPTTVGKIELNWGSTDIIEEFTVTFEYTRWFNTTS